MALFGGTNRAAALNYDQKCKSLYVCLRNSPGLAFYRIPKARRIQRECVRLLRNTNLNAVAIWPVTGQGFQNTN